MTTDERLIDLEGRIAANEIFIRGLLAMIMQGQPGDPLVRLEADRREFKSSLQHLERETGEHADAVWAAAAEAIEWQLDQVATRLQG